MTYLFSNTNPPWGVGHKLRLLSEFSVENSRNYFPNETPFERVLRAAFEPAEGVGRNEVRPQGETFPSLSNRNLFVIVGAFQFFQVLVGFGLLLFALGFFFLLLKEFVQGLVEDCG